MTKEEMNKKITVASNFIAEKRKRSAGTALVTTRREKEKKCWNGSRYNF